MQPRRVQVHPVHWPMPTEYEVTAWKRLDAQFKSHSVTYALSNTVYPTERLEIILSHPSFLTRVLDLALYLERCPPQALKDNFKIIVDNIFCYRNMELGCDMRCIRRTEKTQEAMACFRLLGPEGPLLALALRLMDDNHFLVDFPVDGLPYHLRQKFLRMDIPQFFANKITFAYDVNQRRKVQQLLLNPFEYFFFCFGIINLLGVQTGRTDYLHGWASLQDTIYTNLLEDYLAYYFPCDGTGVPSHNFNYSLQLAQEVFMPNSLIRQQYSKNKTMGSGISFTGEKSIDYSDMGAPTLFKSSIIQDQSGLGSSRDNLFHNKHPLAYKEVWRSETILQVFMEIWMSVVEEQPNENESSVCVNPTTYGGLPTVDVIKAIRTVVRHMHYFMNCVNSHALHPMEDVKRNSYPIFQKRLYKFLRYLFQYWPLDNSFRIIYETWLSYIQPWRYIIYERIKTPGKEAIEVPVDRRWYNFVTENILFYSQLFSQALMRFERLDLTAPKNALMFYRVAKVITCQDCALKAMILEIESLLSNYERKCAQNQPQNYSTPGTSRYAPVPNSGGYYGSGRLSPITQPASSPGSQLLTQDMGSSLLRMANLKLHMKDFEHSQYVYEPLFSDSNRERMKALLVIAIDARDSLYAAAHKLPTAASRSRTLFEWLVGVPPASQTTALANAEKAKAANQLEMAKNQFAQFFEIPNGEAGDKLNQSHMMPQSMSFNGSTGLMQFDSSAVFSSRSWDSNSSDEGRRLVVLPPNVFPTDMLIPLGNPDTSLIRGDECRMVVRWLHRLSCTVNDTLTQRQLEAWYFSPKWTGRFVRAILAEPKEYCVYEKSRQPGKPLKYNRFLPPRILFRPLGSYHTWCYIFALYVFACFLELSPMEGFFLYLMLYGIYVTIRALTEPANKWRDLHRRYLLCDVADEGDIGLTTNLNQSQDVHMDSPEKDIRQRSFGGLGNSPK